MATKLISINEAAEMGISRVRHPSWANKFDHVMIDIVDGKPGPWLHLWAPFNKECNGRDPVDWLSLHGLNAKGFEPYMGPLPDSEEYQAEVAKYDGALREHESTARGDSGPHSP